MKKSMAMENVYDGHNPLLPKLGQNVREIPFPKIILDLRKSQFHF